MKHNALLVTLLMGALVFAGCVSDDDPTPGTDGDGDGAGPIDLGNKGAINGLVVDDNFRPVQLKEDWGANGPGEFQDLGFVLIIETGQRFETNENGEFQVLPLEPGTYTIRVAADNHEAKDTTINVVSGEYTEVTLEARRAFSDGGTVLSQEYVIFIACAFQANTPTGGFVGIATIPGCGGDVSGDSDRFDFQTDYSGIAEDIRGMVTEMRANEDGYYGVAIRSFDKSCSGYDSINGCVFAEPEVSSGNYIHNVLYPGLLLVGGEGDEFIEDGQEGYCTVNGLDDGSDSDCGRYFALEFKNGFQTALFADAPMRELQDEVGYYDVPGTPATNPFQASTGSAGPALGVKAQFLQTVFLYELPEAGIEDFCALCADADIPE